MAASDNLNTKLFHGTGHWFKPGEIVKPGPNDAWDQDKPAAYASSDVDEAKAFAGPTGPDDRRLFYPVFPVEHLSEHTSPKDWNQSSSVRRDTKGFRVTGPPVAYETFHPFLNWWKEHDDGRF